jgi:tetratricopeptide (TPR) repeat protein
MRTTMRLTVARMAVLSVVAIAVCQEALAKTAVEQGDEAYERGDSDLAIDCYTEAIQLDQECVQAYCNRGVAYGRKGDHIKAIADLTEAIRLDPKCARTYKGVGRRFHCQGNRFGGRRSALSLYATDQFSRKMTRLPLAGPTFASFIMDEPYLLVTARYVQLNPVRAKLVDHAREWPWSSAKTHVSGRDDRLVSAQNQNHVSHEQEETPIRQLVPALA